MVFYCGFSIEKANSDSYFRRERESQLNDSQRNKSLLQKKKESK